uniref:GPI transamidase component PIG-S n=1 Tax=Elaeophora elaphi TaxID=1147741 RepID=A0A0R3S5V3_9BILA
FLHAGHNESSEHYSLENIILHARRFATKLAEVSELIISSEHLWDFDLTAWLKKDVQERNTIQMEDISQVIAAIEQETSTVESSAPVMKLVVLDTPQPVTLLDHMGDESNGVVVASWGALLSCGGKKRLAVNQSVIAAMRVFFGLDSDLPVSYDRLPLPVAKWEIKRIKLRSFIDCSINGISSVAAIHKLISQIDNIVINEEVASKTSLAVELISQALSVVEKTGYIDIASVAEGRALAESALNDKSLLSLLYFPNDQKFAIYLPLFLPTLLPLFGSILALNKYWMGKEWIVCS